MEGHLGVAGGNGESFHICIKETDQDITQHHRISQNTMPSSHQLLLGAWPDLIDLLGLGLVFALLSVFSYFVPCFLIAFNIQ